MIFFFPWERESWARFYRSYGIVVANQKENRSFLSSFASNLKTNLEGQPSPGDTFRFPSCLKLEVLQSRACQFCGIVYITIFCCPVSELELKLVLHQMINFGCFFSVGKKEYWDSEKLYLKRYQSPSVILNSELFHLLVNRKKERWGVLFIRVIHNNSHSIFFFLTIWLVFW